MYLKKLACIGFKSFADLVEFEFDPGITAIVGPNGCGKSNVVDAFRWVLGERSAKGLRGKEMLDVIFKGTRRREPLSRAEVTLTFDNEDGTLPVDYSEVSVTRRLYRSGESEYLINNQKCRMKDVLALVQGTGIGTGGYSVLEQGSVDAFLHSNPQERRAIFEEAAGVGQFKKDRTRALNQLDRVENNLARTGDVLTEVEKRIKRVRIQAGKAQRFLEDKELMLRLRSVVAEAELTAYLQEREYVSYKLVELQSKREVLGVVGENIDEKRHQTRIKIDEVNIQATAVRERQMQSRMAMDRVTQRLEHIEERRAEMQLAREQRHQQRAELEQVIAGYEGRRLSIRERVREGVAALREAREQLRDSDAECGLLQEEKNELIEELKECKEDALQQVFAATRLANQKTGYESEGRSLTARLERRQQEADGFEQEHRQLEVRERELENSLRDNEEAAAHAEAEIEILQREIDHRSGMLSSNQRELSELREKVEEQRARLRVLEQLEDSREGVGRGTQDLLNSEHPVAKDILGLVATVIEAEPEFAVMVDAVLGDDAEMVLLWNDTPLEARARIVDRLLAGQGATILQVGGVHSAESVIRATPPEEAVRLLSAVTYAPVVEGLVERLLGDVMVVEDLCSAVRFARATGNSYRFVTREGHLVDRHGAVTYPSSEHGGLVSRRAEIQSLRASLGKSEVVLERVQEHGASLAMNIEARQGELRRVRELEQRHKLELDSSNRRLVDTLAELKRTLERVTVVEHEIEQMEEQRTEFARQLEIVIVDLGNTETRRDELEAHQRQFEDRQHALDDRLAEAQQKVAQARIDATQGEERIISARREQHQLLGEVADRQERLRYLDLEDERDSEKLEEYDDSCEELGEEHAEHDECLGLQIEELETVEEKSVEFKQVLREQDGLSKRIHATYEELRSERETLLLRENEVKVRASAIREALAEEELNLAELPIEEWCEQFREEDEVDEALMKRLRGDLDQVLQRLRKNANVNLEAVQELNELEERFGSLSEQLDDLTNSRDQLMEVIEELNKTSRELFVETFETVRGHFRELFVKIFGGGRADLRLEEGVDVLEAGIIVSASPPGKRISSLQLMSGGEKALTAMAVLFALFRTKPSPFCLLDEVDAPLDEANNQRYIRILQEFAGQAQFLVITHSKVTMAEASSLYGVTMEEEGVSKQLAVRLEEAATLVDEEASKIHQSTEKVEELEFDEIGSIQHPMQQFPEDDPIAARMTSKVADVVPSQSTE